MQLNITFRQFGASDALKQHAREQVERVTRYLDRTGEAHVVLSLERHLHHADITIHAGAWVLRGRERSEDMYTSIGLAVDKIERQLVRYKERLKHHHGRDRVHHRQNLVRVRHDVFEVAAHEPAAPRPEQAEPAAPAAPRVVRSNEFLAQPMTVNEALMQMDLLNAAFLVFQNVETHAMNVVYRRQGGEYGLIDAQAPAAAAP